MSEAEENSLLIPTACLGDIRIVPLLYRVTLEHQSTE